MADYNNLTTATKQVIKQNAKEEITGELLQQVLLSMVSALGVGYQYMGMATPSTIPDGSDARMFYFAAEPGTYKGFGSLEIASVGLYVLSNPAGEWEISDISPDLSDYYTKEEVNAKLAGYATEVEVTRLEGQAATNARNILGKVDKIEGKGLSTNDYTNAEKAKVAAKLDAPSKITFVDGASIAVACTSSSGVIHSGASITTLTVAAAKTASTVDGAGVVLVFSTGAASPAISITGVLWANGDEPVFEASKAYEAHILYNATLDKFLATYTAYE